MVYIPFVVDFWWPGSRLPQHSLRIQKPISPYLVVKKFPGVFSFNDNKNEFGFIGENGAEYWVQCYFVDKGGPTDLMDVNVMGWDTILTVSHSIDHKRDVINFCSWFVSKFAQN